MTKKTKWNTAQWIAFGNRVKAVRKEIQALIMDLQHVARASEIDGLLSVERKIDSWKSKMENFAAKDVPDAILTRLFYGDPLPTEKPREDRIEQDEEWANRQSTIGEEQDWGA